MHFCKLFPLLGYVTHTWSTPQVHQLHQYAHLPCTQYKNKINAQIGALILYITRALTRARRVHIMTAVTMYAALAHCTG